MWVCEGRFSQEFEIANAREIGFLTGNHGRLRPGAFKSSFSAGGIMWRIVLCLIALVIVGDAFAQSQRPSQRGREQVQTHPSPPQQSPAASPQTADPPAAAQPPVTVNVLPTPKTEAERAEEATERKEKMELNRQIVKFSSGLYYATIGLAAATILLVITIGGLTVFAMGQSRAIKAAVADAAQATLASNQIAVSNSQKQLRAYVTARDLKLVVHREAPPVDATEQKQGRINTYGFAAILKNGGQTPANQVEVNVSCRKFNTTIPNDFDFPDSNLFGYGVIGPGGELQSPLIRIAASEFDAAKTEGTWWFWGWVEYGDIFSFTERHRTEFCFAIDRRRTPGTELWVGFNPHSRFNAVDGNCLRPIYSRADKNGAA